MKKRVSSTLDQWKNFLAGDPQALSSLFLAHYEALYNYGLKLTSDEAVVEDCIQEIFINLWQNRSNLTQEISSIRFYLLTSLRHRILRSRKVLARKSDPLIFRNFYQEDHFPSEEERLLKEDQASEQTLKLRNCLDALPRRQREAMYLRFFEELSYSDIADMMACNVQSVRNLIYQSLKRLRQDPVLQKISSIIIAIGLLIAVFGS